MESQTPKDIAGLKARIAVLERRVVELETLCAEVYVAGIELGLPHALITRLWTIAAEGNLPVAFRLEGPTEPARIAATRHPVAAAMPVPDMDRLDRALASPTAKPTRFGPMPHRSVLVVDDDPLMVEVLVRILRHEDFDLLVAHDGPEALAKAEGQKLDLLITDVHMPGMNGPEVADRLRQTRPDLKVLYQTGFSDELFDRKTEMSDNEAFLEKPFSANGLREAARLVLYGRINPDT